jgi:HEPN domain-containing protein
MSDNTVNKTLTVAEFTKSLISLLRDISKKLERKDRMQIALNLSIAFETVNRYLGGEVRRLELAESILKEAREVVRIKEAAPAV